MARCGLTNFATGSIALDSLNGHTSLPSGFSYDSGTVFETNALSLKFVAASGVSSSFIYAATDTPEYAFVRMRVTVRPTTTARVVIGGTTGINIRINPNGTLAYYEGTTLIGNSTTVLSTTLWYTVVIKASGTSQTLCWINGTAEISGTTTGAPFGGQLGTAADTVADTYTVFFAGLLYETNTLPNGTLRIRSAIAVSDNSVGSGWTDSGGATTGLFGSLDNYPPTGIADTTSNAGHQIRNASANTAYATNLATYTVIGLGAGDTVNSILPFVVVGAPVSTGAKAGTLTISNPTQAALSFGNFYSGVAAGTFPTGWKFWFNTILAAPSVTISAAPVMTVTISAGTATRIAMVCAMGMYVDYTPAAVAGNQTASPGLGSLTISGFVPTAVATNNQKALAGLGGLVANGFAPSIIQGVKVFADIGSLIVNGFSPTLISTNNQQVLASVGTLTINGFSPSIVQGIKAYAATGSLTVNGFSPTTSVGNNQTALSGLGSLVISGFAPLVAQGIRANAATGQLTVNGFSPSLIVGNNQKAFTGLGSLIVNGVAPSLTVSSNQIAFIGLGSLVVNGFAPLVAQGIRANIGIGNLTIGGFSPQLIISNNQKAFIGLGSLVVNGFAPQIVAGNAQQAFTGVGQIVLGGFAPSLLVSVNRFANTATGLLVINGFSPSITAPTNIIVNTGLGQLLINGFAPIASLGAMEDPTLSYSGQFYPIPTDW